jgi:hypothetical protein
VTEACRARNTVRWHEDLDKRTVLNEAPSALNSNEKIRSETTCVGGFWAIFGCFGSIERKKFPRLVRNQRASQTFVASPGSLDKAAEHHQNTTSLATTTQRSLC